MEERSREPKVDIVGEVGGLAAAGPTVATVGDAKRTRERTLALLGKEPRGLYLSINPQDLGHSLTDRVGLPSPIPGENLSYVCVKISVAASAKGDLKDQKLQTLRA